MEAATLLPLVALVCSVLIAMSLLAPAARANAPTPYDRMLTVGFEPGADAADRADSRQNANVQARASLAAPGLQQVIVPAGQSIAATVAVLRADGDVSFVEPPGVYTKAALNDPYIVGQNVWGLDNHGQAFACMVAPVAGVCPEGQSLAGLDDADIDAPEAWNQFASGTEPIAIVDTGVAWQHQDLAANIWSNATESSGTASVDDDPYTSFDGSSPVYVDDLRGWDFIGDLDDNGTPSNPLDDTRLPPDNNPKDPEDHGTHVAGVAAAVGNNLKGIAGVNPGAKIMPLRAADERGYFSFGAIEAAFSYAIDHGVRVINGSFSGPSPSPGMQAIITANPQALFVFAAGNGARNHNDSSGASHQYPCDIGEPNVICVAATDWNDNLATYSGVLGSDFGYDSVDIAAPGKAVLSTIPSTSDPAAGGDSDYQYMDGTSMATPYVAGAVSLIWSAHPSLESSQVKSVIVQNTDQLASLSGKVGFGGRLNVNRALTASATPPAPGWPVTPPPPTGTGTGGGTTTVPDVPGSTGLDTRPPDLRVVGPRTVRMTSTGRVSLEVICGEDCAITVRARPNVRGLRSVTRRYTGRPGIARNVQISFTGATLRRVRSALANRGRVGVFVTVSVADAAGNRTGPRSFRISLVR
ncbi:MAG: S8 family serine peptidase [Actinobacteria bacterium]|nr:S8 family serine peptidase [Actinomycetota bacterium]